MRSRWDELSAEQVPRIYYIRAYIYVITFHTLSPCYWLYSPLILMRTVAHSLWGNLRSTYSWVRTSLKYELRDENRKNRRSGKHEKSNVWKLSMCNTATLHPIHPLMFTNMNSLPADVQGMVWKGADDVVGISRNRYGDITPIFHIESIFHCCKRSFRLYMFRDSPLKRYNATRGCSHSMSE